MGKPARELTMKLSIGARMKFLGLTLFASMFVCGGAVAGPTTTTTNQASINLSATNTAYCHNAPASQWTLTKTADASPVYTDSTVTWTITATKIPPAPADNKLCAKGTLTIYNSASAGTAYIGNVVVNLQRKVGTLWVTAASDVANAALGDGASTAKIVAGASSEGLGTFTETSGKSGALELKVGANNLFSGPPQNFPTVAPLDTVNVNYAAYFDSTAIGIAANEFVRYEIIVSFGNAGDRGSSGASAKNLDISGNGTLDATQETYVRSVPIRLTTQVLAAADCNDTLTLADSLGDVLNLTQGGVIATNVNLSNLPATTQTGGTWTVSAVLSGDGSFVNEALIGRSQDACCASLMASATSTVVVSSAVSFRRKGVRRPRPTAN